MNAKYEVKTTMSDDLMRQASILYSAMTQRAKRILRCCVGAVLLIEGGVFVFGGQSLGWLPVVCGAYLFLAAAMTTKVIFHRTVKANGDHRGIVTTIRFDKDRFLVSNHMNAESIPYADVKKIGENKDAFCIVSGKANGTHMPKNCFTLGDINEFRAFIEDKTGKKIKTYR